MAMKPLTPEAIALTEKKMNMTLDEIIKLSKKPASKVMSHRVSNKSQKFVKGGSAQGKPILGNPAKMRQFMDSRASLRQGVLAQRRSNFGGNQFPLAMEVVRKAAVAPIRSRPFNRYRNKMVNWNMPRLVAPTVQRKSVGHFAAKQQQQQQQPKMVMAKQRPRTMDSLFANMKNQRMRGQPNQMMFGAQHEGGAQQQQQQKRRMRVQPNQMMFSAQHECGAQQQQKRRTTRVQPNQMTFGAQHGGGAQHQQQQQQKRRTPRGGFGSKFFN